jgi:UPF0042 nucleotide-binding protein
MMQAMAAPDGNAQPRLRDLMVITGLSGAGKSTAMNVFEDGGYFCVDNLPPRMIGALVELFAHEGSKVEHAAIVSDVRGGDYFEALRAVLDDLESGRLRHRVLFLDADDQTVINRYKETRRPHPLAPQGRIAEGVAAERGLLEPIKQRAELVIDTTALSTATLRRKIAEAFLSQQATGRLAVNFSSFGFKYGPPREADLVFDVRFLPNPHYELELRPLTGRDPRIVEFIGREGKLAALYDHLEPLLDYLLPQYVAEGKSYLSVAVGCTGGRHRSVAIAERLAERYRGRRDLIVAVTHRDIDRLSSFA